MKRFFIGAVALLFFVACGQEGSHADESAADIVDVVEETVTGAVDSMSAAVDSLAADVDSVVTEVKEAVKEATEEN